MVLPLSAPWLHDLEGDRHVFHTTNSLELGGDDADPVQWHAHGLQSMKARALDDGTAWRSCRAIHGVDRLHLAASTRRQLHSGLVPLNLVPLNPLPLNSWPLNPWPDEAQISVGRISVFRQGD
jgi:hypothetical protein